MNETVVFDATFLLLLFDAQAKIRSHPDTGKPVELARERIDGLIRQFEKNRTRVGIPTPALSELLVGAGDAINDYMEIIAGTSCFRLLPFDEKAAVECALLSGGSKQGDEVLTKAKLKFDRQILAIALSESVRTIYTDDDSLAKLAVRNGIAAIKIYEVEIPESAKQGKLAV